MDESRRAALTQIIGAPLWPRGPGWTHALELRDRARRVILEHCGEPDLARPQE